LKTKVIIVGAGPGGCGASLFLSQRKIPHIILDKAVFPRDKICGDALSGKVVEVLKKYDETLIDKIASEKDNFLGSYGVTFVAPNGKALEIPFKASPDYNAPAPGFISRRKYFDDFLVKQLDPEYATLITGAEVKNVLRDQNQVYISYSHNGVQKSLDAEIILGADGDRSIVEKALVSRDMEPDHYCAGIRAYYKNVSGLHPQNFIELHFLEELLPGYFWIFPLADGSCNVGAGMLSKSVSARRVNLRDQMLKAIKNNPNINHRFANAQLEGKIQGWGLPLGSKKRKMSGDRFLLLGDAASLIDPFTGEGIGNALYSGYFAAIAVEKALTENNFSESFLKRAYDKPVYERLWKELKLSHTLQKLSKYEWLFNFVVNRAEKSETLRTTISCMFEDLDMRAQFRNPVFWWKMMAGK
jgi:geranylgeranyl reductase family protein